MSSISELSSVLMTRPIRPSASFMLRHPAHAIALGFGSGLSPKAPGTVGSLWGWASWLLIQNSLSVHAQAALILVALGIGCWACTLTARNMGVSDPGSIVWDEIVAMWLILFLITPSGFMTQLSAFLLFRFLMPPNLAPWLGLINYSKDLAGVVAWVFCLTIWWPLFARSLSWLCGGGSDV